MSKKQPDIRDSYRSDSYRSKQQDDIRDGYTIHTTRGWVIDLSLSDPFGLLQDNDVNAWATAAHDHIDAMRTRFMDGERNATTHVEWSDTETIEYAHANEALRKACGF